MRSIAAFGVQRTHSQLPFRGRRFARSFIIRAFGKAARLLPCGAFILRPAERPIRAHRRVRTHCNRNLDSPATRARNRRADSLRIQRSAPSQKRVSLAAGLRPRVCAREIARSRHAAGGKARSAARPCPRRARIEPIRAHQPIHKSNQPRAPRNRASQRCMNAHLRIARIHEHRDLAGKQLRLKPVNAFIRRIHASKRTLAPGQKTRVGVRVLVVEIQHPSPAVIERVIGKFRDSPGAAAAGPEKAAAALGQQRAEGIVCQDIAPRRGRKRILSNIDRIAAVRKEAARAVFRKSLRSGQSVFAQRQ